MEGIILLFILFIVSSIFNGTPKNKRKKKVDIDIESIILRKEEIGKKTPISENRSQSHTGIPTLDSMMAKPKKNEYTVEKNFSIEKKLEKPLILNEKKSVDISTDIKKCSKEISVEEINNSYSQLFGEKLSSNELKKAIVYAEIFGQPKSLKYTTKQR